MADEAEREALAACVAAVRRLAGLDGHAQARAIEELTRACSRLGSVGRLRLPRDAGLWRIARDLEAVVELLLFGRLPVETTAAVLLDVLEGLGSRLEEPRRSDEQSTAPLRATLEALEAQASEPAESPTLPAWVDQKLAGAIDLQNYERYRLEENLRQGRALHVLRVPYADELLFECVDQIRAVVEVVTVFGRDAPDGHRDGCLFFLIAAEDVHAQLGSLLETGMEILAPEAAVFPDRRADELAWLRNCWAAEIRDAEALARLHEALAACPRPVAEPWREVGRLTVALAELPELEVEGRISVHRNTVMDLAVAPSGLVASVDYSGHWSVWTQAELREQARGDFGHEARAISLSADGARIAALVNRGPAARYNYDAFVVELDGGPAIHCLGDHVERICWEGELLVLGNALGYRIHDAAGRLICADSSPKGLSAACFVRVPPRGELRCIRRNVLGGVEIGTDRALPCLDLTPLDPERRAHWRWASLDVREAGDLVALGPGNNAVFILDLASGRPIVSLVLEGVQIVGIKLAFDASGRYLLMSATHIRGQQVTHLIYDGCRGAFVGRLTTAEGLFAHHARVVMSSDRRRVFAADGNAIVVGRVGVA